jgi:hypothetical protein
MRKKFPGKWDAGYALHALMDVILHKFRAMQEKTVSSSHYFSRENVRKCSSEPGICGSFPRCFNQRSQKNCPEKCIIVYNNV